MKQIPHGRDVDRALKTLRTAVQTAVKSLNQSASHAMVKGDYASAEALVAKAREVLDYQKTIEELRERWRELRAGNRGGPKGATTPLWVYYQPILRALVQAGGESRRADLEPLVEPLLGANLQASDRELLARQRERWRVMIRRARKHLVAEGWIEDRTGVVWRITEAGRRAAEKPIEYHGSTAG